MTDVQLFTGDCLDIMRGMAADSVDTIITDSPYGLSFMGKDWDHGVPGVPFWEAALRVAKPGATLLAFGGTRTFHRLAVAIEDAGWEIRDTVMWVYGSGFPKSHDISKAIDKAAGAERGVVGPKIYADGKPRTAGTNETMHEGWQRPWRIEDPQRGQRLTAPATDAGRQWDGWGTALKPAWEPILVAMKPLDGTFAENALRWGVAGLNIDGGRVAHDELIKPMKAQNGGNKVYRQSGRYEPTTELKPSGRWPANVIHDGSEEVLAGFPQSNGMKKGVLRRGVTTGASIGGNGRYGTAVPQTVETGYSDTGSAARFFYCAKASRAERNAGLEGMEHGPDAHNLSSNACGRCGLRIKANGSGVKCECGDLRKTIKLPATANHHPTVKPLSLMRYLARLTKTPTGGVVLDPFMGSGSTGCGAVLEGRDFIGIDLEPDYVEIARRRIEHARGQVRQEALPL